MSLIALLVEGKTEEIFLSYLFPYIQLPDQLLFSINLVDVLNDTIHKNKIWLKNCQGDRSAPTFIKNNMKVFMRHDFDKIILIRDYFPDYRPPTNLCKKDLCRNLLNNIPSIIISKYSSNIFINLSVKEIEAWFFADKHMFSRMSPHLTEDYINANYDYILTINPEEIRRPSSKLKNIINNEIPNHKYNKTEREIYFVVSKIDIGTCLGAMDINYVQSFYRIVNYLLDTL